MSADSVYVSEVIWMSLSNKWHLLRTPWSIKKLYRIVMSDKPGTILSIYLRLYYYVINNFKYSRIYRQFQISIKLSRILAIIVFLNTKKSTMAHTKTQLFDIFEIM